jgi:hypothetical protein
LTRHELSWLLTQEARAAAQTLRKGVAALSHHPPEIITETVTSPAEIESSLDALDDAMRTLASLNARVEPRGVRGRVDLAALVCEVAPNARVRLAPGSGTEVYGDEKDLRRMIQILTGQTSGLSASAEAPEISSAREGDEVRVSAGLGPETLDAGRTERAWLSRMAVRYGGRLELEGGQESLVLPAEGVAERNEVAALRKELEAAQQQGEAYARELAAVFAAGDTAENASVAPSTIPPPSSTLQPLSAFAAALAAQLRPILAGLAREIDQAGARPADTARLLEVTQLSHNQLQETLSDLNRLVKISADEFPELVNVRQLVHEVVEESYARSNRRGIELIEELPERLDAVVARTCFRTLVRLLIDHGIAATPRDGKVKIRLGYDGGRLWVEIEDAGASVPTGARDALIWRRIDPATLGRPRGVHLMSATAILSHLHGSLSLGDGAEGGTRTVARVPSP